MITFTELAGIQINLFLLIFTGFGAGILSGFAGVGGAFIVTPALIILGFPANFAVGTSLAWVMGNAVIGTIRHRRFGNVDIKLGLIILVAAMIGMEVGVRILNWITDAGLANEIVLSIATCMLLIVGSYTLAESIRRKREIDKLLQNNCKPPPAMKEFALSQKIHGIQVPPILHFARSGVTSSIWVLLAIGFAIGMLSGIIGVGGGFIMVPALVYVVGLSSFMAVGTDLFQIVFSAAYGCIRHTLSGNVVIFAAFIMVIASSIGVQLGVIATRYVRGVSVRIVLGSSILLFAIGSILKLLSILLGQAINWLEIGSLAITFGGMCLTVSMILFIFVLAIRYRRGKSIPIRLKSLVANGDCDESR